MSVLPQDRKLLLPGEYNADPTRAGEFLIPVGTYWVKKDILDITRRITETWPTLRVATCQCNHCLYRGHYPHMVIEVMPDGRTREIFGFTHFDERVIDHLRAIDARNPDSDIAQLPQRNAQARADKKARRKAAEREGLKMVEAALRSHKHDYSTPLGKCDPYAKAIR